MKISAKKRKWLKRISILTVFGIVALVLIYNAIIYRFRDIVQLALDIETKSAYEFDAGKIDVKLFQGKLRMKNAFLKFRDSTKAVTHHDVKIPEVQLELESFADLILQGKLYIKDLQVIQPSLTTTAFENQKNKHMTMQAGGIIENLKKVARHLNVEKFSLRNGEFSYRYNKDPESILTGNRIMINLIGFSDKNLKSNKLGGSSELEISMERQHWVLPDGIHEVFFKSLYFSASRDILEIDSLRIVDHTGIRSKLNFFTEKLRLKSSGLIPSSDENGIYMDSVLVVNPVLELGELKDSKKKVDSNKDSVRSFFDQLLIRYLDIREGQIEFSRPKSAPISTQRSNIKVFNLKLRPNDQRKITSDSINLSLHDIQFYSRDSLFKLNVGHCGFSGQHLNFTNVSYGPSEKNNNFHGLVFQALGLQLKNIDADQLMNKKIHASDAIIIRPDITFFRKSKAQRDSSSALRKEHHNALMENLQNILNVPIIHLQDGRLSVQNPERQQESIEAQHVYLTIMLNQLTKSENRQEIKSSITHFSSERIEIVLPKFTLLANDFVFSGANEASNISRLQLLMKTGNSLTVQNMFWEKLNWDELLNNHRIDLASIRLQQARLKMVRKPPTNQTQEKKKLLLNIGSAVIESLSLESETDSSGFLTMRGKNISTQSLNNESGHMTWKNLAGNFSNLHQKGRNSEISADHIDIRRENIRIQNFQFRKANGNNSNQISIPRAMISAPSFNSAKNMRIAFIEAEHPVLNIVKRDSASAVDQQRKFLVPEDIFIEKINLNEADIRYADYSRSDTTMMTTTASLRMKDVSVTKGKTPSVKFNSFSLQGNGTDLSSASLIAAIPEFILQLNRGQLQVEEKNKLSFTVSTELSWKDAQFKISKPEKMNLSAEAITGNWANSGFSYNSGEKIDLTSFIDHSRFTASNIIYAHPKVVAASKNISWNERGNRSFHLKEISVLPTQTWEEWLAESKWQADYLTVKGESVEIAGVGLSMRPGDTLFSIGKIAATGIEVTTLKDKRKPFRHGIDKGMPTELVERIPFPVKVDTIQIVNSAVLVNQISEKTSKKGTIPIRDLNALITGISNQNKFNELSITASGAIFDNYIRSLQYRENYQDEAGFTFATEISPMVLPSFNPISIPLANIAVKTGNADTLYASWEGNKLAAIGEMDFYYSKLKIAVLNKKNPEKQTPITWAENGLANLFIRNSNNGNSYMILSERNSEKFFFTYWVKSLLSGMMATSGIKSEKKYRKTFKKNKELWQLDYPDYLRPPVNAMK